MKRFAGLTATGLALAGSLTVLAGQTRPNLAGIWTPIEGVNPVVDLLVTQSSTLLTARAGDDPDHKAEYRLDGVATKQAGGRVTTTARWDGARLAIVNTFMSGSTVISTQRQFWSLDADDRLVVETIRERDGKATSEKSVYKRKPK